MKQPKDIWVLYLTINPTEFTYASHRSRPRIGGPYKVKSGLRPRAHSKDRHLMMKNTLGVVVDEYDRGLGQGAFRLEFVLPYTPKKANLIAGAQQLLRTKLKADKVKLIGCEELTQATQLRDDAMVAIKKVIEHFASKYPDDLK